MLLWQSAAATLKSQGMNADDVRRRPGARASRGPRPAASTSTRMVAGINLAVFKNTKQHGRRRCSS